jgi:hypothetical protein
MTSANDTDSIEQEALEQKGTDLCNQALDKGLLVLPSGKAIPLDARDVLRVAIWAANRRARRDKGFPLPKEAFLPETTSE